jgi:hypothetical protein
MKIIKNGDTIIVITDTGEVIHKNGATKEEFERFKTADKDIVLSTMLSADTAISDKIKEANGCIEGCKHSKILSYEGDSVYWRSISQLSIPMTFAKAVLKAEAENNDDALEAYKNFWILLSLNPDSRCRENLYWFLEKWGMKISKSGLFVGYRNADVYQKGNKVNYTQDFMSYVVNQYNATETMGDNPREYWIAKDDNDEEKTYYTVKEGTSLFNVMKDATIYSWYNLETTFKEIQAVNYDTRRLGDNTIYTDHHSHTFKIKIGELVTMPRENCDTNSDVSCSRGLHLGASGWLKKNYFGTHGLVCLCNPAKVVAVPHVDDYGKLRTCEYLPIALVEFDDNKDVIPYNLEDGFESNWVKEILYDGEQGTEDTPTYRIEIPQIPELDKTTVDANLLSIARKYIK